MGIGDAVGQMPLALGNEQTKIIPGHGPVATKDDLRAFRGMLKALHALLSEAKQRGDTVETVLASEGFKTIDEQWPQEE